MSMGIELPKIQILRASGLKAEEATRGTLLIDEVPYFTTLEPVWLNNEQGKSCIPHGTYKATIRQASGKKTAGLCRAFELQDVPKRSAILIHVLNFPWETEGCIGIGMGYGVLQGAPMITDSQKAYKRFMRLLKDHEEINVQILDRLPSRCKRKV